MSFLKPYTECIHDTVRIVAGVLFFQHGAQKIFGVLGREAVDLFSLLGLAGVIELAAGALIALGLFTPWAAFIASGQMAAAFFIAHVPRGSLWPIENAGEPAVLFCFLFLYLASRDSGGWSLDRMLRDRRGA